MTLSAPEADRFNYDERYVLAKIKVALGGRVAEELVFGDVTTGAESDIQQVTQIARGMVLRWGMSEAIGFVAVKPADGAGPLLPGADEVSESTQELVDREVRRIVEEAHEEVRELLAREPSCIIKTSWDQRPAASQNWDERRPDLYRRLRPEVPCSIGAATGQRRVGARGA